MLMAGLDTGWYCLLIPSIPLTSFFGIGHSQGLMTNPTPDMFTTELQRFSIRSHVR